MIRLTSLSLLTLAFVILTGGCATYVNIPPLPGDVASHNPNNASVQHVARVALDETLRRYPPRDVYMIALPEGTNEATYRWVLRDLPDGGGMIGRGMGDEPVYEVASVYVRGTSAQVDIIPPAQGSGQPRLFTVYLRYGWGGWRVDRTRQWNIPVERALRSATPAGEAPAERTPREEPRTDADQDEPTEPARSEGGETTTDPGDGNTESPSTPQPDQPTAPEEMLPPVEADDNDNHTLDSRAD